jgi:hypothetical protein
LQRDSRKVNITYKSEVEAKIRKRAVNIDILGMLDHYFNPPAELIERYGSYDLNADYDRFLKKYYKAFTT